MGEVVPDRTSPTLYPPSPPTVHQLSQLALWELINVTLISYNQYVITNTLKVLVTTIDALGHF